MNRILLAVTMIGLGGGSSLAAPVSITFTNASSEAITAITIIAKVETVEAPPNLLTAAIARGEPMVVQIDVVEDQCIFDMVITFASGATKDRPDTDLCQTEGIIVE